MQDLGQLSDAELLERTSALVLVEHGAVADVVEHLVEIDRRRLYLEHACPSLYAFCVEHFKYTENAALKRIRVARLALQFPRVLDELRSGAIQLTSLLMLAPRLNETNVEALLTEARWKKRWQLERLLAQWFPKPDVPPSVQPLRTAHPSGPMLPATRPGATESEVRPKLEPLSAERFLVQFTASAELYAKLERARELLSHSVPSGELPLLVERALDALIERELKRRTGAGKSRKRREQKPGSRHVPVHVERAVRERDGDQCTFTDADGRRCPERRFLTIEHSIPFALGGLPTPENLCLLCKAHNAYTARQVFGEAFIAEKRAERAARSQAPGPGASAKPDLFTKVQFALCKMGFRERDVRKALTVLGRKSIDWEVEPLLRAALNLLTPATTSRCSG